MQNDTVTVKRSIPHTNQYLYIDRSDLLLTFELAALTEEQTNNKESGEIMLKMCVLIHEMESRCDQLPVCPKRDVPLRCWKLDLYPCCSPARRVLLDFESKDWKRSWRRRWTLAEIHGMFAEIDLACHHQENHVGLKPQMGLIFCSYNLLYVWLLWSLGLNLRALLIWSLIWLGFNKI